MLKSDRMLSEISDELYGKLSQTPQNMTTLFVMAPIMCRFVLWVLQQAITAGKKRLYFLARDGYSMYQTACIFCEKWDLPIDCRYLYCSRYAWRSAEYCLLKEDSISYICLGGIEVTFEKMMRRAGLDATETEVVAEAIGFEEDLNKPLAYNSVKDLAPRLRACPQFMNMLISHSEEKYHSVCGYLEQEGLLDGTGYAVVDSGWVGSMQQTLQNLVKSRGFQGEIEGYYFGMYEYPDEVNKSTYYTWYFGPDEEIRRKVYFSNSLFECIFSSPEGMTIGYEKKNAKYEPILEQKSNPNWKKIEQSTECLKKYAELLAGKEKSRIEQTAYKPREMAAELLYYFMGNPTVQEAETFGNYIFCDDVIGEENQTVAAHLTHKEIKENRFWQKSINLLFKKKKPIKESAWPEGSIMLDEQTGKKGLKHCAFYKYILYWRKSMK